MTISSLRILLAIAMVGPRVASASVLVTGNVFLSGSEGIALPSTTVATVFDSRAEATASDLAGMINWGDGTVSAGTVAALATGGFSVKGTHTYAEEGNFAPVIVSVTDNVDSSTGTATDTAVIADAPLTPTGFYNFSFVPGSAVNTNLISFSDANPAAAPSDFFATINWGDATISSGTVVFTSGSFLVSGTHTYVNAGNFPVTVIVTDVGGSTTGSISLTASTAPEPSSSSVVLAGIGIVALLLRRVRS
jgi:hypothetical protein